MIQPGDEIYPDDEPVLEEDDEINFREPDDDTDQPGDENTTADQPVLEEDDEISFQEPVEAEAETEAQVEPGPADDDAEAPLMMPPADEAETGEEPSGEEPAAVEADETQDASTDTEPAADDASMEEGADHDVVADFYGDDGKTDTPAAAEKIYIGKARRRSSVSPGLAAGWGMLCLGIVATGYLAITQRVDVVRALPGSAWAYELIGMPVNIRGLDFADVAYSWERTANRVFLEVHGDIVNIAGKTMEVPSVVFALQGEKDNAEFKWEYQVVDEPLAAGERATFAVRIPTPPKSIKAVQVRFARAR